MDKKEVKSVLRLLEKAFDESNTVNQYEKKVNKIYENCSLPWNEFLRIKAQVF